MLVTDRIGPRVVESIADRYGPNVELHAIGTMPLALLDCIDGQDLMLIVDACIAGWKPGEVRIMEPDLAQASIGGETSIHQLGPIQALVIARQLFTDRLPKKVMMILVETEGLDDATEERACGEVVSALDTAIAALTPKGRGNE